MKMIRPQTWATAVVAAAGALALVAPIQATAAAPAAKDPAAATFKTRSANAVVAQTRATAKGARTSAPSQPTSSVGSKGLDKLRATKASGQKKDEAAAKGAALRRVTSLSSPAGSAKLAATCNDLALDLTTTADQAWVHWNDVGATGYTVQRQRERGSWSTIGTAKAGTTRLLDRGVNTRALFTYRVVIAGGPTCTLPDYWTTSTVDGFNEPDALYGGAGPDDALVAQDRWTRGVPTGDSGFQPAFSPDGRKVATARFADDSGVWSLRISDPSNKTNTAQTFKAAAGKIALEPSWSPDGRSVAWTEYTLAEDGTVTSPAIHVFDTRTSTDRKVSGGAGLMQADWRTATTLVAAGFAKGEGLFTLPAAGGTRAAVAGTKNAGFPEVAANGTIWFTEGDGTTFLLRSMAPGAAPKTIENSTTSWFEQPRTTIGGELFYVRYDMNDPADPNDTTFAVVNVSPGADTFETAIGAPVDDALGGFAGYDVRQPKSKGSSDLLGDAGADILARDAAGNLWAYPSSPAAFASTRYRVGTGWNIYNAFLVAGDMNGDDRAEILARDKDGRLWRYDGLGGGKVKARVQIGAGWGTYLPVATGDFNGDQIADLVAKQNSGDLWLYKGRGDGTLGARVRIGAGWQVMNSVVGSGDFDLDSDADIVAREASTGKLWLYPGNGTGGFNPRRQVGAGWNIFSGIAGPELLGPTPYIYAKRTDGVLLAYEVAGDGKFDGESVYLVGTGWQTYSFTS